MAIRISSEVHAAIMAEARASQDEICGLLFGNGSRISAYQPCRNVAADPRTGFEIDPQQLIAAHRAARAGGPAIIGCYHSHPSGAATPSRRDAEMAAPDGWLWLIAAREELTCWRAVEHGDHLGRFRREVLDTR